VVEVLLLLLLLLLLLSSSSLSYGLGVPNRRYSEREHIFIGIGLFCRLETKDESFEIAITADTAARNFLFALNRFICFKLIPRS
jgi:hypothetical protein